MKVGDLVIRRITCIDKARPLLRRSAEEQRQIQGPGLVLSKQMSGSNPVHPCISVYYSKTNRIYDIAESLMEILSESQASG